MDTNSMDSDIYNKSAVETCIPLRNSALFTLSDTSDPDLLVSIANRVSLKNGK